MADKLSEQPLDKHQEGADDASSAKPAAASGAESPRTARDPDFDDDEVAGLEAPERHPTPTQKRVSFQDDVGPAPPPKLARPMSPKALAEATLIEAFPAIDTKVVKAVLVASNGKVEPAFNALLGMSDPNFVPEHPPPPPPRKSMSQVESDAQYARQLADQYGDSAYSGFGSRGQGNPPLPARRKQTGLNPNELHDDKEHSFFEDDLPVIRKEAEKAFLGAKTQLTNWFTDIKKKIDGDEDDDAVPRPGPSQQQRKDFGPSQSNQIQGIRKSAEANRRSGERDRYDADPQLLSDDFGHRLELNHDDTAHRRPTRPLANPDLFKATSGSALGATEDGGAHRDASTAHRQPSPSAGGTKAGKWQPLTSVEPNPDTEDHDPFSLGDSDEEQDAKKDIRPEDSERLKKAAAEASDSAKPAEGGPELKPADRKGTIQKGTAEP